MNAFPAGPLLLLAFFCSLGALVSRRPLQSLMALTLAGLSSALAMAALMAPAVAMAQLLFGVALPVVLHLFVLKASGREGDSECRRR